MQTCTEQGAVSVGSLFAGPHNRWATLQGHTLLSQHSLSLFLSPFGLLRCGSHWVRNTGEQGTWRMNFLHVCGTLWPSHRTPMWSPEEKLLQWVTKEGRKHRCAFARGDAVQHGCASWGLCTTAKTAHLPSGRQPFISDSSRNSNKSKSPRGQPGPLCTAWPTLKACLKALQLMRGREKKIRLHHTYHLMCRLVCFMPVNYRSLNGRLVIQQIYLSCNCSKERETFGDRIIEPEPACSHNIQTRLNKATWSGRCA